MADAARILYVARLMHPYVNELFTQNIVRGLPTWRHAYVRIASHRTGGSVRLKSRYYCTINTLWCLSVFRANKIVPAAWPTSHCLAVGSRYYYCSSANCWQNRKLWTMECYFLTSRAEALGTRRRITPVYVRACIWSMILSSTTNFHEASIRFKRIVISY